MAVLVFGGAESGSTQECSAASNGAASSLQANSGTYSWRINRATTQTGYVELAGRDSAGLNTSNFNQATVYVSLAFRYATKPGSNDEEMIVFRSSTADKGSVRINSSGVLAFYDSSSIIVETGSTVLSADTWYALDFMVGTGASGSYEVRINGATELSGTANLTTSNNARVRLGKPTNYNGQTVDFYYDDVIVDNAAYAGPVKVAVLTATSDGSTAQWTAGTNTSDYTQVDEIPLDDTDYIQCSNAGSQLHYVNVTDSSTAGISGTILGVQAWTRFREVTSGTSSTRTRVKVGGSSSESGTVNSATTFVNRMPLFLTDPSTGTAWTTSGIDSMEVGIFENNAIAVRCSVISAFVAYQPSSTVDAEVIGAALSATATMPAASVSGAASVNAEVMAVEMNATASIPAPTVSGAASVAGAVMAATASAPSATLTGSANVSASVLELTAELEAAAIAAQRHAQVMAEVMTLAATLVPAEVVGGRAALGAGPLNSFYAPKREALEVQPLATSRAEARKILKVSKRRRIYP